MSNIRGTVLAATGFMACPCHLPFTLPLLLGVLGGTGVGAFISTNVNLIYGIATGYFILAIGFGVYLLNRRQRGPRKTETRMQTPDEQFTETRNLGRGA